MIQLIGDYTIYTQTYKSFTIITLVQTSKPHFRIWMLRSASHPLLSGRIFIRRSPQFVPAEGNTYKNRNSLWPGRWEKKHNSYPTAMWWLPRAHLVAVCDLCETCLRCSKLVMTWYCFQISNAVKRLAI